MLAQLQRGTDRACDATCASKVSAQHTSHPLIQEIELFQRSEKHLIIWKVSKRWHKGGIYNKTAFLVKEEWREWHLHSGEKHPALAQVDLSHTEMSYSHLVLHKWGQMSLPSSHLCSMELFP